MLLDMELSINGGTPIYGCDGWFISWKIPWKIPFLMDDFCYGIPISGNLHVACTLWTNSSPWSNHSPF